MVNNMDFTLGEFLNLIDYKVSDGSDFLWKCFGPNAYEYSYDKPSEYSFDIIFDTVDRLVYMVVLGTMDKTYHWINTEYQEAYQAEYKTMQELIGFEDDAVEDFTGKTEEFKALINKIINNRE